MQHKPNLGIIGAGLTGLTLAYYLQHYYNITLLEARERIGGRIYTKRSSNDTPVEMGATWLGQQHSALQTLLKELQLPVFEQHLGTTAIYEPLSTSPHQIVQLPPNNDPSFRIVGGTDTIITTLTKKIGRTAIHCKEHVTAITQDQNEIIVRTSEKTHIFQYVVNTLPPALFNATVEVTPNLPDTFKDIASQTHTWMADSIKIAFTFATPFWRKNDLSGTVFSNVGPIGEFYDHSDASDNYYALKGFFNAAYHHLKQNERKAMALSQLEKFFGSEIHSYLSYEEVVWRKEPETFTSYPEPIFPHQNNGASAFAVSYLNNRLYFAGTETQTKFSGYMEGAIRSAKSVAKILLTQSKK